MSLRPVRQVVVWSLVTVDGCFEGAEPWDLEFHRAVWGEEFDAFVLRQGQEIGTLLLGRRTYEGMARYWRSGTGPVAAMMNAVEKAVATRTLQSAEWSGTRVLRGDAADHVRALKLEPGTKSIFVFGSAELVASLFAEGLVDELRLCIAPVVLGAGSPLFKPTGRHQNLELIDAHTLSSGGVIVRYRCACSKDGAGGD